MITLFMKSYLTQLGKVSTLSQLLTEQFSSQLLEKLFSREIVKNNQNISCKKLRLAEHVQGSARVTFYAT